MNLMVAATITPSTRGKASPPFQVNRCAVSGASAMSKMEPTPPAARVVPWKRSTAAKTITTPCTASVFTTEMKPPMTV